MTKVTWDATVDAALADLSALLISSAPLEEISAMVLDSAKKLTDSQFGYVGYIDTETGYLVSSTMTRDIWDMCQVAGKSVIFEKFGGLWGWVLDNRQPLLTNTPHDDLRSSGIPQGHIPIKRFLSAPALVDGRLMGQIALANPGRDYEERDLTLVQRLADLFALAVQRTRGENALRDSEERFATVMNSLQALMYVSDMETHELLFVNQFTRDTFGDIEGQICWQVLQAGQNGPCDFCTNKYLVKDGQPTGVYTWEFQNTVNGRWFHIQDQAIRWVDGRLVRMEVATDVTALKETEEALQKQVAELNAFGHTVAHDLKNPLGLITAYTDLLLEEVEDSAIENELLHQYARILQRTSLKMAIIIDELLLLASIRTQKEIDLRELDMATIVAEALRRLSDMVVEHQAEVIVPQAWPAARGHAPWIEEVWVNYVSNALKYGGRPPHIELGAAADGRGHVRFWVRDKGPGLSQEEQDRLFAPFTRLHQVRAEGHGLGLSIVRRIMDKLGGEAGVKSRVGHGSEFFFILPDLASPTTTLATGVDGDPG